MRTIEWDADARAVVILDQTLLPGQVTFRRVTSVDELVDAIGRLAVRGAPALGVAGALGVALAVCEARRDRPADAVAAVRRAAAKVRSARPTAVNLAGGVDRVLEHLTDLDSFDHVIAAAVALVDDDVAVNAALSHRGADEVLALTGRRTVAVHTHCNAGGLACVEWGTALGIVRALHERDAVREVFADETRPLLQGSRLTAFELRQLGIPHRVVADGAGASVIARGLVDVVVVGADRICANLDVVNKVGTYPLALAAARAGIPFVVAAPESTLDADTPTGSEVHIEVRDAAEITHWRGEPLVPEGTGAWNLAFDVTPGDLVTAIVTERRTLRPVRGDSLRPSAAPRPR
jgi:S-methyl-5-thioribose-1-phosphate isomerase